MRSIMRFMLAGWFVVFLLAPLSSVAGTDKTISIFYTGYSQGQIEPVHG